MTPRLRDVEVKMAGENVAVVSFSLLLAKRSVLQIFGPSLFGMFLADESKYTLSKILVRVGNTWQLFNGEWMGEEEAEPKWIYS